MPVTRRGGAGDGGASKPSSQVTGNVGLYYACYRLSRLGWNAMPTARNARGIDIVVYSANGTRMHGIQVKTLSARYPVPLGASLDRIMGDFWLIVTCVAAEPRTYVLLPSEVRALAHRSGQPAKPSYWVEAASYDVDEFREAWGRIGRGDG